ncbi:MAG TPA: hypothetical protein VGG72_10335 [Bryobacteraceae bacterium]
MAGNSSAVAAASEHQRLLAEYHAATVKYAAAVGELSQHLGSMVKEDYDRFLRVVEDARNDCERVRKDIGMFHLQQ